MAFVGVAATVGGAIGLGTGTAAIIGGGALIGAGVGGAYSAITGDGNILNSMLTGGLIGGGGAYGIGAMGYGGSAVQAGMAGPAFANFGTFGASAPSTLAVPTANVMTPTAAQSLGYNSAAKGATGLSSRLTTDASFATSGLSPTSGASNLGNFVATKPAVSKTAMELAGDLGAQKIGMSGAKMLGYGLAGSAAMQLLGGGGPGAQAPASATYPGDVRPYQFAARPVGQNQYPTSQYDMAGNPILDTQERSYFDQSLTPLQAYRAGTANPNPTMAAQGGLMAAYPMEKYGNAIPNTEIYGSGMAEGGEVDMDERRRKSIMKNIKGASNKQLENILGAVNQQEFLMKNMPNYAEAMRPSVSGMVEGAQYGDRMAQSYGAQPRDINVMPTMVDPQSGMYGGIASIARQIDPQTRVNAMANIQRTPYDRNAMDAVRRLGVGVDRQVGKDTNLSAFYEQDPMGRDKMGGVRLSQRFAEGGMSDLGGYSDGGRLLRGPGDGVSDNIPAVIGNKQPARLADGEFVIPARIVSELGNGSTDAGAKRLYAMMDKIQAGRKKTVGKGKVAVDSKAMKHLPA